MSMGMSMGASTSAALNVKTANPSDPSTMYSTTTEYTLVARGLGLGNSGTNSNEDDLSYLYGMTSGNGTYVARVRYIPSVGGGGSAGGGIMVRASLANNAPNVTALLTDGNGVTFSWRGAENGPEEAWPMSIAIGVSAPIWLKLVKAGDSFTVSYSQDGSTWYNPTSVNVRFRGNFYVGLASTAHDAHQEVVNLYDSVAGFSPATYVSITA